MDDATKKAAEGSESAVERFVMPSFTRSREDMDRTNAALKKLVNAGIATRQAMINFSKAAGLLREKSKLNDQ